MASQQRLLSGAVIPCVALGTWQSRPGEVQVAVNTAIRNGYRHLDCASNYLNEHEIGQALKEIFSEKVITRDEIFITGKLNNPYHRKEHVKQHLLKTLKDLQLDYLDLWLMHWPVAFKYVPFDMEKVGIDAYEGSPDDAAGGANIDRGVSIRETWEAMEALVDEGYVKAIGVSNFNTGLLHDLLTYARIKPAVLQVEAHPYLQQRALLMYCQKQGIVMEAYSPLGAGGFIGKDEPRVLSDKLLAEIGAAHGKSSATVALRWAVQRGTVVLPKSVHPDRIKQNIDLFDFELTEKEMEAIAGLEKNHHFLRPNDWYGIPLFTP